MLPCRQKHGINVWEGLPRMQKCRPCNAILNIEICIVKALVVESAYVIPSVCVHNNTQEQKTDKKWGRPGSIHHVNDVRWTLGGCRVGGGRVQAPNNALVELDSRHETTHLDRWFPAPMYYHKQK